MGCPNVSGMILFDLIDQVEEVFDLMTVYPLAAGVPEVHLKGCIG
jgi:hypothetical protein